MIDPSEKNKADIYKYTMHMVLAENSRKKILNDLITKKGLDEASAKKIIDNISDELLKVKKAKGKINLILGTIIIALGLGVSILSISIARKGGLYLLTIGIVLGGFLKLGQGFMQYFSKSPINRY